MHVRSRYIHWMWSKRKPPTTKQIILRTTYWDHILPNKNKIRFYIASFEIKLYIFAKRDRVVHIKKNKIITLITKSRSFVTFVISFFSLTIYVTQTCTMISFSDRVISYLRPWRAKKRYVVGGRGGSCMWSVVTLIVSINPTLVWCGTFRAIIGLDTTWIHNSYAHKCNESWKYSLLST